MIDRFMYTLLITLVLWCSNIYGPCACLIYELIWINGSYLSTLELKGQWPHIKEKKLSPGSLGRCSLGLRENRAPRTSFMLSVNSDVKKPSVFHLEKDHCWVVRMFFLGFWLLCIFSWCFPRFHSCCPSFSQVSHGYEDFSIRENVAEPQKAEDVRAPGEVLWELHTADAGQGLDAAWSYGGKLPFTTWSYGGLSHDL